MGNEAPIRAAQYVRMSTDLQVYSTANQEALIGQYAQRNGFEVVRTYADTGRSGLMLKGRSALQQLLSDVLGDDPGFSAILVYDVSRWGRFQDVDESAHYEFLCRRAGVQVHYCAETFGNDASMATAIMKGLKRVMAGEYSRELSAKTRHAKFRQFRLGFYMGGKTPYGFRRLLLNRDGTPKLVMSSGDTKHLGAEKVVLIHGPPEELATVRGDVAGGGLGHPPMLRGDPRHSRPREGLAAGVGK